MSASPGKPVVSVRVWSDLACPWCWVGWNRLNQAMEDLEGRAAFDVRWHAFLLDSHFPEGGEEIESYYHKRFGSQAPALRQRLHDSGKWDGAPFASWRWRANTQGANELVALAGRSGKSHEACGLLFRKTNEEGANLSDRQELLSAARLLGLLPDQVEGWLGSPEARDQVATDDREAKSSRGIHSVPTFFVSCSDSKPVQLVGAESVKTCEVAFRKVLHEAHGVPPAAAAGHGQGTAVPAGTHGMPAGKAAAGGAATQEGAGVAEE